MWIDEPNSVHLQSLALVCTLSEPRNMQVGKDDVQDKPQFW